ncbi:MAG: hypothetical protein MUP90_01760, partial [Gammaproteobacteria bacterium]|nr:hypothetical protein [Gammaproteobacteria bacterium]
MRFTLVAAAMVLTGGVAGAGEDSAVAGSPTTTFRIAQAAEQQSEVNPQASPGNEADLEQSAETGGKCDPARHADGDCPHMRHGEGGMGGDKASHGEHHKCPMADGDCPHMRHGEGGMSGDKASHGDHHKCEMADGDCPHMQ